MKVRKDPVDNEQSGDEIKTLTLKDLKAKTLSMNVVRASDPFATYPLKHIKTGKMVPVYDENGRVVRGKEKEEVICTTHILLYNHTFKPIRNDPANRGKIRTCHNRSIQDPYTEENYDLVFDRVFEIEDGVYQGCYVPQDALRAQCYFKVNDRTGRIEQDERYLLLDDEQGKPLLRLYQMIINPKIKMEQQADYIMGETKVDPGDDKPAEE